MLYGKIFSVGLDSVFTLYVGGQANLYPCLVSSEKSNNKEDI